LHSAVLVVLLQSYVYFGYDQKPIIYIYNKTSMDYISSYRLKEHGGITGGVTDMAMYASDVQPSAPSKSITLRWIKCDEFTFRNKTLHALTILTLIL